MSASPAPEFVDSNVVVYAHDTTAGDKREAARALLARLWRERGGALSIQVLQEFAVTVTRKLPRPLALAEAREVLVALGEYLVHSPQPQDVVDALELQNREQLSFWDAMLVRSAARLGCRVLWSEDFQAGRTYDGVEIRNPFAPEPAGEVHESGA